MSGHTCNFRVDPQRDNGSNLKITCSMCNGSAHISRQSCNSELCIRCWPGYCNDQSWDPDLSEDANIKCDELGISLSDRLYINQYTVHQMLDLPSVRKFRHVSDIRRNSSQDRFEDCDPNSTDESDESENESDRDFIVSDDSEPENLDSEYLSRSEDSSSSEDEKKRSIDDIIDVDQPSRLIKKNKQK